MPTANYGYTAPLNPPGVSPPLSEKQVWDALLIKVRDAPQFLAVIDSVKVLSEGPAKDGQFPGIAAGTQYITREAVFKSGQGPPDAQRNGGKMVEDCFCYEPNRVDFTTASGNFVSNVVTVGPEGRARKSDGADDLYLTYTFSWIAPPDSSATDIEAQRRKLEAGAKTAVEHSVEAIRGLVKKGVV